MVRARHTAERFVCRSLDGDYRSPVPLVLGVRQLGVQVRDAQLVLRCHHVYVDAVKYDDRPW